LYLLKELVTLLFLLYRAPLKIHFGGHVKFISLPEGEILLLAAQKELRATPITAYLYFRVFLYLYGKDLP